MDCSTESLSPIDDIGGDGEGGSAPDAETQFTRRTVSGEVTWTVAFDATAKAAGATDCSYTRQYSGVEDASAPWQCPTCTGTFRADVSIIRGLEECYPLVSQQPPQPQEWIGFGDGPWWRGIGARMGEQGMATVEGTTVVVSNTVDAFEAPGGGMATLEVAGQLLIGEENGDPLHGFRVSDIYTCGWEKAGREPYRGDYTLVHGETLPDGVFRDVCEDYVRLHDLAGTYLIVDMSAMDCPPCRRMASIEEEFVAEMADQGYAVNVVTLLAPSLDDTLGETTTDMLQVWIDNYTLTSPKLADRGWGLSMFRPALEDETGFPSWVIAAPDLTVIDFGTGFNSWAPSAARSSPTPNDRLDDDAARSRVERDGVRLRPLLRLAFPPLDR